jgi:hypothetical protein
MASSQAAPPPAAQPQTTAPPADFPRELRFIFVQLLFSLTAAETARQFAELVLQGRTWDGSSAYAHLVLAGAVVITSWVGWTKSEAGRRLRVDSVFSLPFLVLLADVGLVFLYFILVRGAEIPSADKPVVPSAFAEAITVAWIFIGYFVWDVLTKAVISAPNASHRFLRRLFEGDMRDRGWISFICMILGILGWIFLSSVTSLPGVLCADAALFFLVFLFRALKEKRRKSASLLVLFALGSGAAARWYG